MPSCGEYGAGDDQQQRLVELIDRDWFCRASNRNKKVRTWRGCRRRRRRRTPSAAAAPPPAPCPAPAAAPRTACTASTATRLQSSCKPSVGEPRREQALQPAAAPGEACELPTCCPHQYERRKLRWHLLTATRPATIGLQLITRGSGIAATAAVIVSWKMKNLRTGGDVAHGIAVLVHRDVAALAEDDHVGRLAGAATTHL